MSTWNQATKFGFYKLLKTFWSLLLSVSNLPLCSQSANQVIPYLILSLKVSDSLHDLGFFFSPEVTGPFGSLIVFGPSPPVLVVLVLIGHGLFAASLDGSFGSSGLLDIATGRLDRRDSTHGMRRGSAMKGIGGGGGGRCRDHGIARVTTHGGGVG